MNPIYMKLMNFIMACDINMSGTAPTDAAGAAKWSVSGLLKGAGTSLETWGKAIVAIVGVVMVIVGVVKIGQGMMSGGRGQVNWVMSIGLILIGGMLAFAGGWSIITSIGTGTYSTLNQMGNEGYKNLDGTTIIQGLKPFLPVG